MDWSKKIGIAFIIVLFLASCSNRKSYGSIYFSGGAELNDSTVKNDLSIHDYMSTSEISLDIHESVDKYSDEKTDSITRQNFLNLPIDPQDSLQTISKIKEDSLVSFKTPDTIDSNRVDSLNSIVLPNKDLIEYSRDSVDHSDEEEIKKIDTSQMLSQEEQIRMLNKRNDSINRANIEEVDSLEIISDSSASKIETAMDTSAINVKSVDSTLILSQQEQINALKAQNDSLNRAKVRAKDSIANAGRAIAVPVIIEENQEMDTTKTIIKDEIEKGVLLNDRIVEGVDSIEVERVSIEEMETIKDGIVVDSLAEVPKLDTMFYSISFDSTSVELNDKARQTLNKLIKVTKLKNYALQLSGRTESKSEEAEKSLTNNRVNAVVSYLVSNGMKNDNITALPLNQEFKNSNINMNQGNVHLRLIVEE